MDRYELQETIYSIDCTRTFQQRKVWKAIDRQNGTEVAVKQVVVSNFGDYEKKIYYHEINALKKLGEIPDPDEFIVRLYDHFLIENGFVIVTRFIPGKSIKQMVEWLDQEYNDAQQTHLDFRWKLICDLTRAIHFIHNNKFIHSDLNTGNIICENESVKIIDFEASESFEDIGAFYFDISMGFDISQYQDIIDELALPNRQFRLARYFSKLPSREEILEKVWGPEKAQVLARIICTDDSELKSLSMAEYSSQILSVV